METTKTGLCALDYSACLGQRSHSEETSLGSDRKSRGKR